MLSLLLYDPSVVVGSVLILAMAWRWFAVPSDRLQTEYLLLIAIFPLIVSPVAQAVADGMSRLRPMKLDLYAYAADGHLGQPAFALGRVVGPQVWVKALLNIAYGLLPIGVILTLWVPVLRRSAGLRPMVWAFILNLVIAPVFYLLVPVCGPEYAFPMFPLEPGQIAPHMMSINAAPNGIPSVHMSTALLIAWFSRKSRARLAAAIGYLLLIAVACLASGQHYAVDLLAAVPYAAGVAWLVKMRWFQSRATSAAS